MRGRKPIPTHLKIVTGNQGKRPFNPLEPMPEERMPDPPRELCEDGVIEWQRISSELAALGLMTNLDRGVLTAYCDAYGRWAKAKRLMNNAAALDPATGGMVIVTMQGNRIQNPLLGIVNKAAADMVRYAAEFGMTPSARSRVNGGKVGQSKKTKPSDPASRYFA